MRSLLLLMALLFPRWVGGQPAATGEKFTERSPAYFVDRYGAPKGSSTTKSHAFVHPKRGAVTVSGQFAIREFRDGDLRVRAVFFLPALKLAAVRFDLPRTWTQEQINAALAGYGADWKNSADSSFTKVWTSPDGALAISMLTSFEIQSPAIVSAVERSLQEMDGKRNAVPKF